MYKTKINISFVKTLVAVVLISLMPTLGLAHHSSSEFTPARIELEGTLLQLSWRNPHPSLTFQSSNTEALWNIQLPGTIESLSALGITADSFEIGQIVNIAGLASNRIENYIQGTHVLFPNGNELILKQGLQPLWTQPVEIISEAAILSDAIIIEESVNFAISNKFFLILSIFFGLTAAYSLKTIKMKNLQASL